MHRKLSGLLIAALCTCQSGSDNRSNEADNAALQRANEASAAVQDDGMVRFVNSRQNALSENLRRFYVDFSFAYPSTWSVTPPRTDGTERNYVRAAAPPIDGYEPFSFHVGFATGSGNAERDRRDIERALPQVAEQFGSTLEEYRVASVGRDRVGPYESWNWRFSARAPAVERRPARMNGRGDVILPPGASRGVLIISLVTDRTDETPSPQQVGEEGTLKAVYDSFRLGGADGR